MQNIIICDEFTDNNVADICKLEKICFDTEAWSDNSIKDLNHNIYNVITAYKNNNLIAYIIYSIVLDEAELLRIAVAKEHRRKNIATTLLTHMLEKLDYKQVKICFLEVKSDNLNAINLYKKFSFEEISVRKNYYSNNISAIIMKQSR